jgi:hypothetical protein
MFNSLFELIRDSTKSTNNLINEVGKERSGVNEFIQLVRDRPCFDNTARTYFQDFRDKSIATMQAQQDKHEKDSEELKSKFVEKLKEIQDADNKRLITVIYILIGVNTSVLCVILYFIATNPQVWNLLEKLLGK